VIPLPNYLTCFATFCVWFSYLSPSFHGSIRSFPFTCIAAVDVSRTSLVSPPLSKDGLSSIPPDHFPPHFACFPFELLGCRSESGFLFLMFPRFLPSVTSPGLLSLHGVVPGSTPPLRSSRLPFPVFPFCPTPRAFEGVSASPTTP